MKQFILLCIFGLTIVSCSKLDENLLGEIPFTIIYEDSNSLITEEDTWVIKNEYAWEEFKLHSFSDAESFQFVDFNTHIILAVSLGQKPTGGYSIAVHSIIEFDDHLQVNIQKTNPLAGEDVTLALSQPLQIVMIEKTEKSIVFN